MGNGGADCGSDRGSPAQIPACGFPAPGSCRRSGVRLARRNSTKAMALQASVKRGTAEVRNRLFETTQAIVGCKPHASAVYDDQRLGRQIEDSRLALLWPFACVFRRARASPSGDGLGVHAKPCGQSPLGFLALLDLATGRRIRRGVRMKSTGHFTRVRDGRCTLQLWDMRCKWTPAVSRFSSITLTVYTNDFKHVNGIYLN